MGTSGHKSLVADAERVGVNLRRTTIGGRPVTRWGTTCSTCGKEQLWGWGQGTGVHFMLKNLDNAGWSRDRKGNIVCDSCNEEKKQEKRVSKIENIPNPKLQRKVFTLLEDHFDEERRLYRAGWSDKKVAAEAQTSEQYVAALRSGAFGELAEDPTITALRSELAGLREEAQKIADELMERMGKIEEKITTLHSRIDGYALKKAV